MELGQLLQKETMKFGPLTITRLTKPDSVQLFRSAVQSGTSLDIAICNAHTALTALDDPAYAEILSHMTVLNDGVGISLASRLLHGRSFPDNLNGTDLIPRVLSEIGIPLRIYLLGAKENQVVLARKHIEAAYPQHTIVGCRDGYFDLNDSGAICEDINRVKPDLLLVGMGNPRQETFVVQNRHRLDATVTVGVGALFDFMSGAVIRAPKIVQAIGLEWLFRLLQEPRRLFRRYVYGIPRFLIEVLKLKFKDELTKPVRSL